MRKIFTILSIILLNVGVYAATEQAWYNDVTSITANGQYYIYSVNGKGFMQAGQSQVKSITTSNYNNASTFYFKIANPSEGTVTCGSYYLKCYKEVSGTTSGPTNTKTENGTNIIFTSMNSGEYWNIHGHYNVFGQRYPALFYKDGQYDAYIGSGSSWGYSDTKDLQTAAEYRWYVVSQAQLDRHFAIYFFDAYKESLNISQYNGQIPAAYYTALEAAYNQTFSVQNAAHSAEVVNAAKANLENLYNGAAALVEPYATATAAINALEAVEDKGEDYADVTADITNARTALEAAMSVSEIQAAVAGLKAIDPITFNTTTFTALQPLGTPASTVAGRTITYAAADNNIINAQGMPIYKGTTTLVATAAATDQYYKFVRSAQVTVNALPTTAQESKTIVVGAQESWNGIDLSTYAVGTHSVEYVTTNAQGGVHTITLTLTVNKMETLAVAVPLTFCAGGSETYRGTEYTEAGVYDVPAVGATRDTLYTVTVTVLQPTTANASKTITVGDAELWNGIDLSVYPVGTYSIPYTTTNAAGCDSTITLALTVSKQATMHLPVELEFCQGDSVEYRGTWYTEAKTFELNVPGEVMDTIYDVTVTVHASPITVDNTTVTVGQMVLFEETGWLLRGVVPVETSYATTKADTADLWFARYSQTEQGCEKEEYLYVELELLEPVELEKHLRFCDGDSVEYRGVWYTTTQEDVLLVEGEIRDTLIYVTAFSMPVPAPEMRYETVLSGHDFLLPEGEWMLGDTTVSGVYQTVQSGEAVELEFLQLHEDYEGCGDPFIHLILTIEANFEAVENAFYGEKAEKFFRDGVMYIRRGDRLFTTDGREVK